MDIIRIINMFSGRYPVGPQWWLVLAAKWIPREISVSWLQWHGEYILIYYLEQEHVMKEIWQNSYLI